MNPLQMNNSIECCSPNNRFATQTGLLPLQYSTTPAINWTKYKRKKKESATEHSIESGWIFIAFKPNTCATWCVISSCFVFSASINSMPIFKWFSFQFHQNISINNYWLIAFWSPRNVHASSNSTSLWIISIELERLCRPIFFFITSISDDMQQMNDDPFSNGAFADSHCNRVFTFGTPSA